ncbi:MAG: molecular chaperone TorD family protein [Deltaproteobacteria bacterium]|nr:molecular chaperone TorD family protein [Deltaproteobacteria bacterium]
MNTDRLELNGPEQEQVGCRRALYSLISKGFRFPTPEQFEGVKKGRFAEEVAQAVARLPYDGVKGGELGRGTALSYDEFQGRYIQLFEVGGELGAPCFLYEAEYGGGRMKVMEEVLRFYHHFGLRLSQVKRDRPDHLASELEFMHVLTFREAEALLQGSERRAYRAAARDFLRFHVSDLIGAVASKVAGSGVPFYSDLANLAAAFCQRELAHVQAE